VGLPSLTVDVNDRDAWYAANPSMGVRISEDWVAANELALLSTEGFMIERLGVVFEELAGNAEITVEAWNGSSTTVHRSPVMWSSRWM
jgi:hypothetical protein